MKHKVALATKHGKLDQLLPAFELLENFELVLAEIDTDVFGTFSGETPRLSSPLETAIAKAKAGAAKLGLEAREQSPLTPQSHGRRLTMSCWC
jgi:hypothetical protein